MDEDQEQHILAEVYPHDEAPGDASDSNMQIADLQRDLEQAEQEFMDSSPPAAGTNTAGDAPPSPTSKSISSAPPATPSGIATEASSGASSDRPKVSSVTSSQSTPPPRARNPTRDRASSLMSSTTDWYDEDLLHRAVADAGRWAYGTIFVEVWLLTEDRFSLVRPNRGWWIDPINHMEYHAPPKHGKGNENKKNRRQSLHQRLSSSSSILKSLSQSSFSQQDQDAQSQSCPNCRLTNKSRPDYLEPGYHIPGEGLPGILWADDHNPHFLSDRSK
jgi:hypothetical protein